MPADPSAVPPPEDEIRMTPALDALLKRVRDEFSDGETDRIGERFLCYHAAPSLAAIVRVLVEGMNGVLLGTRTYADGWAALARAEAIAKGES